MTFPRFFIDRPIFAIVLSVLMMIGGIVSFFQLPLSEYPAVTPPTVQVTTAYPGANPDVIAQTVATPLEQAEKLEQLRFLEHGLRIAVGVVDEAPPPGVDCEEDLQRVEAFLRGAGAV